MPGEVQFGARLFTEMFEAEARENTIEVAAMNDIEPDVAFAPGADFFHASLIFAAPGIGESAPIESLALGRDELFSLARDAASEVDERTEDIEKERFYRRVGHGPPLIVRGALIAAVLIIRPVGGLSELNADERMKDSGLPDH